MRIIKRREAKEAGLEFYYTGKPCKHGHLCRRKVKGGCVRCITETSKKHNALKPKGFTRQYRIKDPIGTLVRAAASRARKRGTPFNLSKDDIRIPDRCPVLGIPLVFKVKPRRDNSASLDEIISGKGYTRDNVVIVSWRANRLKSNATIKELQLLASFYTKLTKEKR